MNLNLNTSLCFSVVESAFYRVNNKGKKPIDITKKTHFWERQKPHHYIKTFINNLLTEENNQAVESPSSKPLRKRKMMFQFAKELKKCSRTPNMRDQCLGSAQKDVLSSSGNTRVRFSRRSTATMSQILKNNLKKKCVQIKQTLKHQQR